MREEIAHPGYDRTFFRNDIGIIKLDGKSNLTVVRLLDEGDGLDHLEELRGNVLRLPYLRTCLVVSSVRLGNTIMERQGYFDYVARTRRKPC